VEVDATDRAVVLVEAVDEGAHAVVPELVGWWLVGEEEEVRKVV
jgi:hypothetical protein